MKPKDSEKGSLDGLATSFLVFLVTLVSYAYWQDTFGLKEILSCSRGEVVDRFQLWRLFTSLLIHRDLSHLLHNLSLFAVLGYMLLSHYGVWAFPVLPFAVMTIATYVQLLTYTYDIRVLGLSGVVFFMAAFWLTLFCFTRTRYSKFIRFSICVLAALFGFFSASVDPEIAYRAHFIGAVFGFTSGVIFYGRRRDRPPIVSKHG